MNQPSARIKKSHRKTLETEIEVTVNLDGTGQARAETGLGFLDHMLTALSRHSGIDIAITCRGDTHIDDHHTAEDCALALGACLDAALGERRAIARFGYAYAPLDEALARAVIDLSGRPHATIELDLKREALGAIACENLTHFMRSLAVALRASLHVDVLRGDNDHHKAEAAFKALALALKAAVTQTAGNAFPSTKGVL